MITCNGRSQLTNIGLELKQSLEVEEQERLGQERHQGYLLPVDMNVKDSPD